MRAILIKRIQQALVVAALAMLGGCSKSSDVNEARRMPKLSPADSANVPVNVKIAVDVDGQAASPIDAQRLSATAPDFRDAQRRAWKLSGLIGSIAQGALVEIAIVGSDGVAVTFPRPASANDPQPVLMENRRGEIVATMVAPAAPFPAYHNEGGRLHRPGDSTPRVEHVTAIRVRTHPAQPQPTTK
jgi:hypothetical protein